MNYLPSTLISTIFLVVLRPLAESLIHSLIYFLHMAFIIIWSAPDIEISEIQHN